MPIIRVQHSFQGISGVAKDQYVNTFHAFVAGYDNDSLTSMASDVKDFYEELPPSSPHPVSWWLAGMADTAGARIKIYDLSSPVPRATIYDEIYTPVNAFGGGDVPLPSEVAVCLSYAAAPVSGINVARTRGRIYIGPLSTTAVETVGSSGIARPNSAFRDTLVQAAGLLASSWADATPTTAWVVYSPTSSASHIITHWWCDDAWDTQRRRGDPPTSRSVFP